MWDIKILGFTFYQIFWYFCIYAFLGWCTEVVFCTLETGAFVNRGFLNGTVCPIYGFGMVIVLLCLTPIKDNLLVLFIGSVFLTTILEGITGFVLEKLFKTQWWDYSDMPFNIGGYVCLKFSLLWGVGCILIMKVIHPLIAQLVALVPPLAGKILAVPVFIAFLADFIVTVQSIAKLNKNLGELETIASQLKKHSTQLAKSIGNTALDLRDKSEEVSERLETQGNRLANKIGDNVAELKVKVSDIAVKAEESIDELKASYAALQEKTGRDRRRLIKAFPKMKNRSHNDILTELKEKLKNNAHK